MTRRLERFLPQDLDEAQRALYDAIVSGPRGSGGLLDSHGSLRGPFNAMLLAPELGQLLQAIGASLRYRGRLSDRVREMSTLLVAAAYGSAFERSAHEPAARAAGVTDDELTAIAAGGRPELEDEAERVALDLVAALLREHRVDDATYERAVATLTGPVVFELSTLVGYYGLLATQLALFGVD
jgi:4-carboxymuconolactone decarboxylase